MTDVLTSVKVKLSLSIKVSLISTYSKFPSKDSTIKNSLNILQVFNFNEFSHQYLEHDEIVIENIATNSITLKNMDKFKSRKSDILCEIYVYDAETPTIDENTKWKCSDSTTCSNQCNADLNVGNLNASTNYIIKIKILNVANGINYEKWFSFRTSNLKIDITKISLLGGSNNLAPSSLTSTFTYTSYEIKPAEIQQDRKICRIYIKRKIDTDYSIALCENSNICEKLCSETFKIEKLKIGTEYDIQIETNGLNTRKHSFKTSIYGISIIN